MYTSCQIEFSADCRAFSAAITPHLLLREAENGMFLGIVGMMLEAKVNPGLWMATVRRGQEVLGGAVRRSATRPLILSALPDTEAEALAAAAHPVLGALDGVLGPIATCTRFSAKLAELRQQTTKVYMAMRVHSLERVLPVANAPGSLRLAGPDDTDQVAAFVRGFCMESLQESGEGDFREMVKEPIRNGRYFVWEDGGKLVSMASVSGETLHSIRISTVFTPPALRGHGYATACVSALSSRMLADGRGFTTLYTDLTNPTSNSIYAKIGYRPVADFTHLKFS